MTDPTIGLVLGACALTFWITLGATSARDALRARQGGDFLFALGVIASAALGGWSGLAATGGAELPCGPIALLLCTVAALHRRVLGGGLLSANTAPWFALAVLLLMVGLALLRGPFGSGLTVAGTRPAELVAAVLLIWQAMRAGLLPRRSLLSVTPPHASALLAGSAVACLLRFFGNPSFDNVAALALAVVPLPALAWRLRISDPAVRLFAAGAVAATLALVGNARVGQETERLHGLAVAAGHHGEVEEALQRLQQPLDEVVATWAFEVPNREFAELGTAAGKAAARLRTSLNETGDHAMLASQRQLDEALQLLIDHGAGLMAAAARRHQTAGDATAQVAEEAAARRLHREAALAADKARSSANGIAVALAAAVTAASAALPSLGGIFLALFVVVALLASALVRTEAEARRLAPHQDSLVRLDVVMNRISRQLREPLTTLVGSAELMASEGIGGLDRAGHACRIIEQGRRIATLLDQVSDLERLGRGELQLCDEAFCVDELCQRVVAATRALAGDSGTCVTIDCSGGFPRWIRGDAQRTAQVLRIVLERALGRTRAGLVSLTVCCEGSWVMFEVTDEGRPETADDLEALFDAFSAAIPPDRVASTNVAMTLARRLARCAGGDLRVSSSETGSKVVLQLPLRPAEAWEIELEDAHEQAPARLPTRFAGNALLVEDCKDQQVAIASLLRHLGLEVAVADDAAAALHTLDAQSFDVLLVDMQLPEMDGRELVSRLRNRDDMTPVVALSASAIPGQRELALASGCNAYLQKPVDRSSLRGMLALYLAGAEPATASADPNGTS